MPEMQWHDSVLVELRRTRQAVEKLVELLDRPSEKVTIASFRQTNELRPMEPVPAAQPSENNTSYADWRRKEAVDERATEMLQSLPQDLREWPRE